MELIKSKNEQTPLVVTSLLDNPTSDAHTPPMLCSHCLRSESREAWPYCKGPVPSPSCMLQKTCATTMEHTLNLCRVVVFATLLLENSSLYIQFLYEIVESQEKKMEKFSSIRKSQTSRRVEQLRE